MSSSAQQRPGPRSPLVVSLPGAATNFAAELAQRLDGEFKQLSAEEIVSPGDPEYVVGAVVGNSVHVINADALAALGVTEDALAIRVAEATARNAGAMQRSSGSAPCVALEIEREVIVVDDGSAAMPVLEALAIELSRRGARSIVLLSDSWQHSVLNGYDEVRGLGLAGAV